MHGGVPGYGTFRTADGGWIALGVIDEQPLWEALVNALGLGEIAPLSFVDRVGRTEELNDQIASRIATLSRDDVVAQLSAAGAPVSAVLGRAELADDPQLRGRGVVVRDPDGRVTMRHPLQYRQHPAVIQRHVPPLAVGFSALPGWRRR